MDNKIYNEMIKTKNWTEFNDFLSNYYPEYDYIDMSTWDYEVYKYFIESILHMTIEAIQIMNDEIINYEEYIDAK